MIPNADRAIMAPSKLRDYLLNAAHKKGGSKARLLIGMGYTPTDYSNLEADLRVQHLTLDPANTEANDYGTCYEIVAPLVGPTGKSITFRSVWQIDLGTDVPRLITMVPE